ncbi:hypothetical protein [Azospirillum canadense]|uniref:hypothetical protein n=1 Tax=Azospirillum canadense TaxID=403962 RepID=UPI002227AE07|nr:hypothetical protein [Azospirillum canadense]MCW2241494.1 hypothetical protein [Azospirillum canadense]
MAVRYAPASIPRAPHSAAALQAEICRPWAAAVETLVSFDQSVSFALMQRKAAIREPAKL